MVCGLRKHAQSFRRSDKSTWTTNKQPSKAPLPVPEVTNASKPCRSATWRITRSYIFCSTQSLSVGLPLIMSNCSVIIRVELSRPFGKQTSVIRDKMSWEISCVASSKKFHRLGTEIIEKRRAIKGVLVFQHRGSRKSLNLFIEKRGENNNGKQGGLPKKDSGDQECK